MGSHERNDLEDPALVEVALKGGCPHFSKPTTPDISEENPNDITESTSSTPATAAADSTPQENCSSARMSGNQLPTAGQRVPLPTHRMASTIPNAGADKDSETWMYPSEQMFYNAMKRKGHAPSERDMRAVVAIHNTVNEQTWKHILEWEALRGDGKEDYTPRLVKFVGRPSDLSPKARFRSWIGYTLPFDRHDWVVERPDGEQTRASDYCVHVCSYVIDYYNGKPDPQKPCSVKCTSHPDISTPDQR